MNKINILLIIISTFSSCSEKINKSITGNWIIDEIEYENQDIKYDLLVNMIEFKIDGTCNLPTTMNQKKEDKKGTWILNEENSENYITIKSSNDLFDGRYKLSFEKDYENKLFKMVLESSDFYLRSSKLLQNFDKL